MDRVLNVEQIRNADKYTIESIGIPETELIERAGKAIVDVLLAKFKGGRILICLGKGNNAEDGKIVKKLLRHKHGFIVKSISIEDDFSVISKDNFDIILDCIFGTGLNRNVDGEYKNLIDKINHSGCYVISCDIPSGLNGNNGLPMGCSVKANLTVAIQEYKLGYFLNDGPDYCGEIIKKDIGISVWEEDFVKIADKKDFSNLFTKRNRNVNKGNFGKVCVFGGSKDYPGSVLISYNALCGLKMGSGYSNITVPECVYNLCAGINPENTVNVVKDNGEHILFDKKALDKVLKYTSVAFGMGLKSTSETYHSLKYLLENYTGNLLVDADGLNALAQFGLEILCNKKCEVILTPHVGEFSRLINVDKKEILLSPISYAKDFAKKYNVILVLKSAVSIITDGKEVFLNTTGCSALAKGGSGDLLSGIIIGLSDRARKVIDSAVAGCYIFGKTGEIASESLCEYTVTASDIIYALPNVINSIIDD